MTEFLLKERLDQLDQKIEALRDDMYEINGKALKNAHARVTKTREDVIFNREQIEMIEKFLRETFPKKDKA